MDVLSKQSEVFRELQMEDDFNSEMMSVVDGMGPPKSRLRSSSGVRSDYHQSSKMLRPASRGSKVQLRQSKKNGFFTISAIEGEESIAIELDDQPQTVSRRNLIKNNLNVAS